MNDEGSNLLDAIVAFIRRWVVLSPEQAAAVALFVVFTHTVDAFGVAPYVHASSPTKRSGKTRLLEVLELLVASPLRAAAMSEAALFRSLAEISPTLLFDEVDAIFSPKARDREDLR